MIAVLLHDAESVTINAAPKDVKVESGVLVVRRDGNVVGSFRRFTGWHEMIAPE